MLGEVGLNAGAILRNVEHRENKVMAKLGDGGSLGGSLRFVGAVLVVSTIGYLLWETLGSLDLNPDCVTPWGTMVFDQPPPGGLK